MIKSVSIKNYRSIISDQISLAPITVLIGANGSGKSNLVKALQFLSDIPDVGLSVAVSKQGGRESVVPKAIPENAIHNSITSFEYCIELPSADSDITSAIIPVHHKFSLKFPSLQQTEILEEELHFEKVLYTGEVLATRSEEEDPKQTEDSKLKTKSYFKITRTKKDTEYDVYPKPTKKYIKYFLHWLGLPMFEDTMKHKKDFDQFIDGFLRSRITPRKDRKIQAPPNGSFLDPKVPTIIDFSQNFQIFLSKLRSIQRYDLLLHQLRNEQAPTDSTTLSSTGENMPAALRGLQESSKSYNRLKDSFEAIAPHIFGIKSSPLQTGKEFVEFAEDKVGRGVESWQSSDGTLRALAILVAIESAHQGSTVIIEEIEQNIHPWSVRTIMDHIRLVVEENNIQVILTTHSEHVLERLDSSEVRVVTRDGVSGTKFNRLDQMLPNVKIDMGDIGRLWVKGMLGGIPTHYES